MLLFRASIPDSVALMTDVTRPSFHEYTCTLSSHESYWHGVRKSDIENEVSRDERALLARFPGIRIVRCDNDRRGPALIVGPDAAVCHEIEGFLMNRR